ncbi:MFS transporter [Streptomyces sp. NPDC050161]|uniref:MFS transporter n=1 Tax=Streptomyces sp. NPDC050161 TaxID=3365604 RepID=UPI0037A7B921
MRRGAALAVLALATFVVVTTELLPVGLLRPVSADLGVSESRVGLLVTVYAFTVGLSAAPLTAWTARWPRKRVFLAVCAVFALGTVLAAGAVDYAMLAAARFLCGAAHGVFWSVAAGYASAIARPGLPGRATALIFAGNSAALVLGVPLGTALGSALGWRAAFSVVAALAVLLCGAALWALPDTGTGAPTDARWEVARDGRADARVRAQDTDDARAAPGVLRALRLPGVLPVVGTTALLVLGHFTLYTYVTPLLRDLGVPDGAQLGALLGAYGLAGLAGTWVCGLLVDRRPRAAVLGTIGLMATAMAALLTGLPEAVAMALWGAAFAAVPVCLQTTVLRLAPDAPDAASSWYVAGFNLGIGSGALAGGLVISAAGLPALGWVALALVLGALALGHVVFGARRSSVLAFNTPAGGGR